MDTHNCKEIAELFGQAKAFRVQIQYSDGSWYLNHGSLATEIDVKGGEAEYVSEVMGSLTLYINFCPYCGEKLKGS